MTSSALTTLAVLAPLCSSVLLLLLWPARLLIEGLLSALPGRLSRWLPPAGRCSRAVGWAGLFGALLPLVLVPMLTPVLALPGWSGLDLTPGLWLVAVTVAVVGLCAGVAAWMDDAGRGTWALLTGLTGLLLAAVAAQTGLLVIIALDTAGWLVGLALILTGRSGGEVDVQLLRRLARRYLILLMLSSAAIWSGMIFLPSELFWQWVLGLGLAMRAAAIGVHTGGWSAYVLLPTPLAMILAGAMFPVAALLTAETLGHSPLLALWLLAAAALFYLASLRETDFRHAAGRWLLASLATALAIALATPGTPAFDWTVLTHDPRTAATELACVTIAAAAAAAAMATYLTGAVQRATSHLEISRMGGLAARLPALFGWSVVGAMLLAGAVPFASIIGRIVLSLTPTVPLWLLLALSAVAILALTCNLTLVQRIFLGTPRTDADPVELSGRERLVLVLLAATAVIPLAAPLTLLRNL